MKILYFRKGLNRIIYAWPYIWAAISIFWLFIIVPIFTLIFNVTCWIIESSDDDNFVSNGENYNLFTGEIDPYKRVDGRYSNDSPISRDPRH